MAVIYSRVRVMPEGWDFYIKYLAFWARYFCAFISAARGDVKHKEHRESAEDQRENIYLFSVFSAPLWFDSVL